jgi:glycosyltransferase involved in cell wall biosynthesis
LAGRKSGRLYSLTIYLVYVVEVLFKVTNLFANAGGGAEYVIANWLKNFQKIKPILVPTVDGVYNQLCGSRKSKTRSEIEDYIKKLSFEIENTTLESYLECSLHEKPEIYKRVFNDSVVFDPSIGIYRFLKFKSPLLKSFYTFYYMNNTKLSYIYYALKYSRKYIGFLQFLGDRDLRISHNMRRLFSREMSLYLRNYLMPTISERKIIGLFKKNSDKVILLASSEGVLRKVGASGLRSRIVFPYLALPENVLPFAEEKEDYAVFFARAAYPKGILDAIKVFKKVRGQGVNRLYIIGDKEKRYHDPQNGICSLGWVENKSDVYKTVSRARVSIYPSFSDVFGITVLETIGVGTPVVMYYNEANYEIFSKSSLVKVVKTFDVNSMAKAVIEVIKEEPRMDEYTRKLVEMHLDWKKVTSNLEDAIIRTIEGEDSNSS